MSDCCLFDESCQLTTFRRQLPKGLSCEFEDPSKLFDHLRRVSSVTTSAKNEDPSVCSKERL